MRTFDADIGSCLQGLFFDSRFFCENGRRRLQRGKRLQELLLGRGRDCNAAGCWLQLQQKKEDRGRVGMARPRNCCSNDLAREAALSTLSGQQ